MRRVWFKSPTYNPKRETDLQLKERDIFLENVHIVCNSDEPGGIARLGRQHSKRKVMLCNAIDFPYAMIIAFVSLAIYNRP